MSDKAVFLDRDDTLIEDPGYINDPDQVKLLDGTADALIELKHLGYKLVVVTNQSAVARGILDVERLGEIHQRMVQKLEAEGVRLASIHYCPHHPDEGCVCRKPGTGMVEQAAEKHGFDASQCFVVGDMASDVELGCALGATTLLVRTGHGSVTEARMGAAADHVVEDLREAADVIERLLATSR